MMAEATNPLFEQAYIQYGFAGFCVILIGLLIWVLKQWMGSNRQSQEKLVDVIEKNNSILAKLIDQLKMNGVKEDKTADELALFRTEMSNMRVEIAKRPCMEKSNV